MLRLKFAVVFGITLLISVLCDARAFDHDLAKTPPNQDLTSLVRRQTSGNTKRCRTVCSSSTCGGSTCTRSTSVNKRNLNNVFIGDNTTMVASVNEDHQLFKRVFQTPVRVRAIGTYLTKQSANANTLSPDDVNGIFKPTLCLQYKFSKADVDANGQWLAGTADTVVTGCTILTVVSSRAVYMCHIWEDINFQYVPNSDHTFVGFQQFLDLITNGGPQTESLGPKLDTTLFTGQPNDRAVAYVMTPRYDGTIEDPLSQDFPLQIGLLEERLKQLIPGIEVVSYNYVAPDETVGSYPANQPWQGVALFEYDWNADGSGNADWRLWQEQTQAMGRRDRGQVPVS